MKRHIAWFCNLWVGCLEKQTSISKGKKMTVLQGKQEHVMAQMYFPPVLAPNPSVHKKCFSLLSHVLLNISTMGIGNYLSSHVLYYFFIFAYFSIQIGNLAFRQKLMGFSQVVRVFTAA